MGLNLPEFCLVSKLFCCHISLDVRGVGATFKVEGVREPTIPPVTNSLGSLLQN